MCGVHRSQGLQWVALEFGLHLTIRCPTGGLGPDVLCLSFNQQFQVNSQSPFYQLLSGAACLRCTAHLTLASVHHEALTLLCIFCLRCIDFLCATSVLKDLSIVWGVHSPRALVQQEHLLLV